MKFEVVRVRPLGGSVLVGPWETLASNLTLKDALKLAQERSARVKSYRVVVYRMDGAHRATFKAGKNVSELEGAT